MRLKAHEARALILRGEAPEGLQVDGSLFIRFYNLDADVSERTKHTRPLLLPSNLTVHGSLDLWGSKALLELPRGMTIKVTLGLAHCTALTSIPADLDVGRLMLTGCTGITRLPEGIMVREWIDVAGTRIHALPESLKNVRILWDREAISADELRSRNP